MAFELRYDSLRRLEFKEVACMLDYLDLQLPNWLIKMSFKEQASRAIGSFSTLACP
jgi:hypothetical protein